MKRGQPPAPRRRTLFWVVAIGAAIAVVGVYAFLGRALTRKPPKPAAATRAEDAARERELFDYAQFRKERAPSTARLDAPLPTSMDELRAFVEGDDPYPPWGLVYHELCSGNERWFQRFDEAARAALRGSAEPDLDAARWRPLLVACRPARHCAALAERLDSPPPVGRLYWSAFTRECLDDRWRSRVEAPGAPSRALVEWQVSRWERGYPLDWSERYEAALARVIEEAGDDADLSHDLAPLASVAMRGDEAALAALVRLHEKAPRDWRRGEVALALAPVVDRDRKARAILVAHCRNNFYDDECLAIDEPSLVTRAARHDLGSLVVTHGWYLKDVIPAVPLERRSELIDALARCAAVEDVSLSQTVRRACLSELAALDRPRASATANRVLGGWYDDEALLTLARNLARFPDAQALSRRAAAFAPPDSMERTRPPGPALEIADVLLDVGRAADVWSDDSHAARSDVAAYRLAWLARPHLDDVRFELTARDEPRLRAHVGDVAYSTDSSAVGMVNALLRLRRVETRCLEIHGDAGGVRFACGPRDALLELVRDDLLSSSRDLGDP